MSPVQIRCILHLEVHKNYKVALLEQLKSVVFSILQNLILQVAQQFGTARGPLQVTLV